MQMKKRSTCIILMMLTAMFLAVLLPSVFAEGRDKNKDQVHVIIENNTFLEADPENDIDEPAWTGTLVDTWVDIDANPKTSEDSAMSCIKKAIEENGFEQIGADGGYISTINGLSEFDGGQLSGWMGTLNDWFTSEGFNAFSVKNGKLSAGDEMHVMYTCAYGADLGGTWSNNDTFLKDLRFTDQNGNSINGMCLSPALKTETPEKSGVLDEYILSFTSDVTSFYAAPEATNKNFQVRAYYFSASEAKKVTQPEWSNNQAAGFVKRTAELQAEDGAVLYFGVGCQGWPTMNNSEDSGHLYKITLKELLPVEAEVKVTCQQGDKFLNVPQRTTTVKSDLAEQYGYQDKVNKFENVSALDVLVQAHIDLYGEKYSKNTASGYLQLSEYGYLTTIFGEQTSACGFTVNDLMPVDPKSTLTEWGYTAYSLNEAKVNTGDQCCFYTYQDTTRWSDTLNWISVPKAAYPNQNIDVSAKGVNLMMSGAYAKNLEELQAMASASAGYKLGWVDMANGKVTEIVGVVLSDEGKAVITAPEQAGTYYLTVLTNTDLGTKVYATMNPTALKVVEPKITLSADKTSVDLEETFTVTLGFNGTLNGFQTDLKYDQDKIEFVKVDWGFDAKTGDDGNTVINASKEGLFVSMNATGINPLELEDDCIAKLTFKAKDSGTVKFSLDDIECFYLKDAQQIKLDATVDHQFQNGITISDVMMGDVDLNKSVTIIDANLIQLYKASLVKELSPAALKAADVYHDGEVDLKDVNRIQVYLAKLVEDLVIIP